LQTPDFHFIKLRRFRILRASPTKTNRFYRFATQQFLTITIQLC